MKQYGRDRLTVFILRIWIERTFLEVILRTNYKKQHL